MVTPCERSHTVWVAKEERAAPERLPLEIEGLELLSDEGLEELRQIVAAEIERRKREKASAVVEEGDEGARAG
jgi:hypothetical protein